jgi:hypothetical protein
MTTGEDYRNTSANKKCPQMCPATGRGRDLDGAFKPTGLQKHRRIMQLQPGSRLGTIRALVIGTDCKDRHTRERPQ